MTMVYLIQGYLIPELIGGYVSGDLDADMAICKRIREVVSVGYHLEADNQGSSLMSHTDLMFIDLNCSQSEQFLSSD